MKTAKDLLRGELIGKKVEVVQPKRLAGIHGIIVDETKHLLKIKTEKGTKMVQKKQAIFSIWNEGKPITVEGRLLEQRPEDRVR